MKCSTFGRELEVFLTRAARARLKMKRIVREQQFPARRTVTLEARNAQPVVCFVVVMNNSTGREEGARHGLAIVAAQNNIQGLEF